MGQKVNWLFPNQSFGILLAASCSLKHVFLMFFCLLLIPPTPHTHTQTHLGILSTGNILPRQWLSHTVFQRSMSSVRELGCTGPAWSHSDSPRWPPLLEVPRTEEADPRASQSAHTPESRRMKAGGSADLRSVKQRVHVSSSLLSQGEIIVWIRPVETCSHVLTCAFNVVSDLWENRGALYNNVTLLGIFKGLVKN